MWWVPFLDKEIFDYALQSNLESGVGVEKSLPYEATSRNLGNLSLASDGGRGGAQVCRSARAIGGSAAATNLQEDCCFELTSTLHQL